MSTNIRELITLPREVTSKNSIKVGGAHFDKSVVEGWHQLAVNSECGIHLVKLHGSVYAVDLFDTQKLRNEMANYVPPQPRFLAGQVVQYIAGHHDKYLLRKFVRFEEGAEVWNYAAVQALHKELLTGYFSYTRYAVVPREALWKTGDVLRLGNNNDTSRKLISLVGLTPEGEIWKSTPLDFGWPTNSDLLFEYTKYNKRERTTAWKEGITLVNAAGRRYRLLEFVALRKGDLERWRYHSEQSGLEDTGDFDTKLYKEAEPEETHFMVGDVVVGRYNPDLRYKLVSFAGKSHSDVTGDAELWSGKVVGGSSTLHNLKFTLADWRVATADTPPPRHSIGALVSCCMCYSTSGARKITDIEYSQYWGGWTYALEGDKLLERVAGKVVAGNYDHHEAHLSKYNAPKPDAVAAAAAVVVPVKETKPSAATILVRSKATKQTSKKR